MLELKRKDQDKYLSSRKQIKGLIYRVKTWQCSSVIDMLECIYKISHFFHTYYVCFQQRAAERLVSLQRVMEKPTAEAMWAYIMWRWIAAISISNALEIYEMLNVNLKLEHIRGESFYSGISPITQEEIDVALKIRKLYTDIQPKMMGDVEKAIEDTYGVEKGEHSEKGYDNIEDIPSMSIMGPCGKVSFCPAILMDDGKYHIWNR